MINYLLNINLINDQYLFDIELKKTTPPHTLSVLVVLQV